VTFGYQDAMKIPRGDATAAAFNDITSRLIKGGNDREMGILAGTFLENLLYDYLKKVVVDTPLQPAKKLFEYPRPLSSFGGMLSLSLAFGLISEFEFSEIKVIKTIRNMCAHSLSRGENDPINFDAQPFQDVLREWYPTVTRNQVTKEAFQKLTGPLEAMLEFDPRMVFRLIFCKASLTLFARIAMAQPIIIPSELDSDADSDPSAAVALAAAFQKFEGATVTPPESPSS
jgi:hypothetical protein